MAQLQPTVDTPQFLIVIAGAALPKEMSLSRMICSFTMTRPAEKKSDGSPRKHHVEKRRPRWGGCTVLDSCHPVRTPARPAEFPLHISQTKDGLINSDHLDRWTEVFVGRLEGRVEPGCDGRPGLPAGRPLGFVAQITLVCK